MEEVKEHIELIEKLVKANPKFSGNEDLLEDFCSETYQKSFLILQSAINVASLEGYMKKVVSSAIMDVLKKSGRLGVKTSKTISLKTFEKSETKIDKDEEIQKNDEIVLEETQDIIINDSEDVLNIEETSNEQNEEKLSLDEKEEVNDPNVLQGAYKYNKSPSLAQDLLYVADPRENIEEQIIEKNIIENIINLVKNIDEEKPQEMFFILFKERYVLGKKQKEIADDLKISQAEVSKRLVQLSRLIKEKLY